MKQATTAYTELGREGAGELRSAFDLCNKTPGASGRRWFQLVWPASPPLELDAASPLAHDGQQQHSDSLPALLQSCLLALLLEQQGGSSGQASS